jgi:hypothetical protein
VHCAKSIKLVDCAKRIKLVNCAKGLNSLSTTFIR